MIGTTLGPYRIDALLGTGGMGTVYRATVVGKAPATVALKVVHPHLLATAGFFKRFLREADVGRRVVHENVVRTIDADSVAAAGADGETGEQRYFLVMEYVEGQTLRGLLEELGRVPEALCRHVGREVAKGLAAIHAAGVVHRDLKPENVLITKDQVVKVMDLGVARLAEEAVRLSQTGAFVGSVQYSAPEQFMLSRLRSETTRPLGAAGGATGGAGKRGGAGHAVDHRADLHALGLILYELSTGRHPYQAGDFRQTMRRVLDEKPRRPAELNSQLSPFFEELVLQLLAKDREKRIASAAQVAQILLEGEKSGWWMARAKAIRTETKRPLRRIRIQRETALFGREREIALLRSHFERASAGAGLTLLVEGEAGIGKTRLVDEFAGLLREEGVDLNFLFGSYPPGGAATGSGAFSTAYRQHFGDESLDDALSGVLPQTPLLASAFTALLRGDATPKGGETLTKDSLQTVFVHVTRALAAERPTIVLIDDLHFAPEEGRALFAALALAVPGHAILLVGTARPGIDGTWLSQLERAGAARLALPRLSPKDLVQLLGDAFHSQQLAEELAGRVAAKSDGNPFFVFEILRGLRESNVLTRAADGSWVTTSVIRDIRIPSSVLDLVQARVADLAEAERDVLDVASCLGFEFDPMVLVAVMGLGRIPTLKTLSQIERAHRLVRASGRRFVFDHHQVQEALYAALPEMLREEYHGAIGEAIEAASGAAARDLEDADGSMCVDLAEHFLLSRSRAGSALRYLPAALTHLEKNYLNDVAVRLAGRALAVPGLLAGGARIDMLLRKAERHELMGSMVPELAATDEAVALADATGDVALRARAHHRRGHALERAFRVGEAVAELTASLSFARAAGDRRTELAAENCLGDVTRDGSQDHRRRALELARELGDRRGEALAIGDLGDWLYAQGRFAEAREQFEREWAIHHDMGDRARECHCESRLGTVAFIVGNFDEARIRYERSLVIARETGSRRNEATAVANLGNIAFVQGNYEEAEERYRRYVAIARETGNLRGEAILAANLGNVQLELGRRDAAQLQLERSLGVSVLIGDVRQQATALRGLATVQSEAGDAAGSERLHGEALELRRNAGDKAGAADSLWARGSLFARAGRLDDARRDLIAAEEAARETGHRELAVLAIVHLARLPGGDVPGAARALAAREQEFSFAAGMEAYFVLWQSTQDPAHLAEARRRLDHLVAHAPADCRTSMLANVHLHREITAAVKDANP